MFFLKLEKRVNHTSYLRLFILDFLDYFLSQPLIFIFYIVENIFTQLANFPLALLACFSVPLDEHVVELLVVHDVGDESLNVFIVVVVFIAGHLLGISLQIILDLR